MRPGAKQGRFGRRRGLNNSTFVHYACYRGVGHTMCTLHIFFIQIIYVTLLFCLVVAS